MDRADWHDNYRYKFFCRFVPGVLGRSHSMVDPSGHEGAG